MEKLRNLYSHFAREVLKKDYLLGAYWEKDNSFDIVSIEEENDCLYVKTRELLSKEYGFIKWLVENDKISIGKCENVVNYNSWDFNGMFDYEMVLMLLSISDNPISDLCSYLKEEKKPDFGELFSECIIKAKRLASE